MAFQGQTSASPWLRMTWGKRLSDADRLPDLVDDLERPT